MTLNILRFEFFYILLEFIINLRTTLNFFVEELHFNVILPCSEKHLANYVFNISTCTLHALSPKKRKKILKFVFVNIN